jgi:uncharacterized protein
MTASPLPKVTVDLEALDAFLLSDRAPEDGMGLSDLDGFLTGIIVGPELITPSEWLPVVWDDEEPAFADMQEAESITGAIMGRYNEIITDLDSDPSLFHPIYWETNTGNVIVSDWAAGFLDAVNLRVKAWEPLLRSRQAVPLILPLVGLGADEPEHPPFGFPPFADRDIEVWQLGAVEMIPLCVRGIQAYWQERRQQAAVATARPARRAPSRRRR